jgi:uncharacterized membrane protein
MNYNEIQPNGELKAYARQQLNGVWGAMAFTYFVLFLIYLPYYFISTLSSIIDSIDKYDFLSIYYYSILDSIDSYIPEIIVQLFPVINFILSIAAAVVTGPFALGFAGYFLKRVRGQEIATINIFDGFYRFSRSFLVQLLTQLFTFLWCLLLIIPGIIKALGYSMAFNIMYDNPEIKPLEAIKRSQIMMKGYKGKLFLLELSFIGWMILAAIPFGLGFLWLYPYMNLSLANFYENLKRNQENNQTGNPAANQAKPPIDLFQST